MLQHLPMMAPTSSWTTEDAASPHLAFILPSSRSLFTSNHGQQSPARAHGLPTVVPRAQSHLPTVVFPSHLLLKILRGYTCVWCGVCVCVYTYAMHTCVGQRTTCRVASALLSSCRFQASSTGCQSRKCFLASLHPIV